MVLTRDKRELTACRSSAICASTLGRTGVLAITALLIAAANPSPAHAACTVTGTGTQTTLQSGDSITCTGAGNTVVQTNNNESNITVNIGDGSTATTLDGGANAGIGFDSTSNSTINIFNQAAITSAGEGVHLSSTDNVVVNIDAGSSINVTNTGASGIWLQSAANSTINIDGTLDSVTPGAVGLYFSGTATGNVLNIGATGVVQADDQWAVYFTTNAAATNTINNSGLITTGFGISILGAPGTEIVVNSGTIEKLVALEAGADTVVNQGTIGSLDLGDGDDTLELRNGYNFVGTEFGGAGTDILRLGGAANSVFDLSTFGAGLKYREFETLQKTGASTWTLTGTTTDAANMDVQSGTLIVNGSMVNIDTLVSGGTLGGAGTIGDVTANSGGTVAPGNSIGTLNVNGNVTFNNGSVYEVEVNAAGQSDLTNATGTATINSGTVSVITVPGAYGASTQYTILTAAGGVTGAFGDVTLGGFNPLFFASALTYDAFNVFLTLDYNDTAFLDLAGTPNQKAVAGAMFVLGGSAPFLSDFVGLSNDQIKTGLDTLSGEAHASVQSVLGAPSSLFAATLRNRLATAFDAGGRDKLASAAKSQTPYQLGGPDVDPQNGSGTEASSAPSPYLWLSGAGEQTNIDGDGKAAGVSSNSRGVFAGLDVPLEPNVRLGFAGGWSQTDMGTGARFSSAEAGTWHVAVTGASAFGDWRLRGVAAYAGNDVETQRMAVIGTDTYSTHARYDAERIEALAELGHVLQLNGATLEPYAGAGVSRLETGTFTETGGGAANLTSSGETDTSPFSVLGLRFGTTWVAGAMQFTPSLDLAWRHVFDGLTPTATLAFAATPTVSWIVAGAPIARDALLISAGFDAAVGQSLSANLNYYGDLAGSADQHAVEGAIKLKF